MTPRFAQADFERPPCRLCGETSSHELFHTDLHGIGLRTAMCSACGLVYLTPRLTADATRRFYGQQYRELYATEDTKQLDDAYLRARDEFSVARFRYDRYAPYLTAGGSAIDVGCGHGLFLWEVARHIDIRASGIEPDPHYAAFAAERSGLRILGAHLEDVDLPRESFDQVIAFHVLEHAPDPLDFLRRLTALVQPGGHLILEVPNILGQWKGLEMLHVAHTHYFSPNTVRSCIEHVGLEVVSLEQWEDPRFASSMSVVARKTAASRSASPQPADDPETMRALFRSRLARWRWDQYRNRASRLVARVLGPAFVLNLRRMMSRR